MPNQCRSGRCCQILTLQQRVAELEAQNRAILETLQAIKSKMGLEPAVSPATLARPASPVKLVSGLIDGKRLRNPSCLGWECC
jgi:hypothetical protein